MRELFIEKCEIIKEAAQPVVVLRISQAVLTLNIHNFLRFFEKPEPIHTSHTNVKMG